MTSERQRPERPIRRRRPPAQPELERQYRPIAPIPAASEPSDPPVLTEAQCLALLVKRYRWTWVGSNQLRRYDPFGAMPFVRKAATEAAEALNCNGEGASHAA